VVDIARGYARINFFVERMKPYAGRGRRETEDHARSLDTEVRKALREAGEVFYSVDGTEQGADEAAEVVLRRLAL
jgi:hypothetical protein